jgi:C4-dicarboxylate-specific signal transduction histidine kinase
LAQQVARLVSQTFFNLLALSDVHVDPDQPQWLTGIILEHHRKRRLRAHQTPLNRRTSAHHYRVGAAAQLTSQLLAYAGKGQFVTKTVNLSDLVSRSTPLLSASIPKRVNLVFRLSQEDLVTKADPSQIEQILMNLVINAAEAIPSQTDGRIEIVTGRSVVSLEMAGFHAPAFDVRPGHFVFLKVTDNGSGMDEATMEQIFDPFFLTKFRGRGLGLAAVQGILRRCNGFIDVRSSPDAGSTFRVYLPAVAAKPAAETPAGPPAGHFAAGSWTRDHPRRR